MFEWIFSLMGGYHNYAYWASILGIYYFVFQTDKDFLPDKFSNSFISSWGVIYLIWAFFAWYGGFAEMLETTLRRGNTSGMIGELIGGVIGCLLFSLVLNYIYIPIKNAFMKLHEYANKEDK